MQQISCIDETLVVTRSFHHKPGLGRPGRADESLPGAKSKGRPADT